MANPTNSDISGVTGGLALASFEKELICSICTEILYQPLTILNCLHTFCGSCLKEWFSHQHRKASSSRSTPSTTNPYSCPTCRAEVRDVQHNATVSNLLELFLSANPSRNRTQEEKDDMDKIYKPDGSKPGDRILPKLERRRDRRARREAEAAAREREMLEEARQQSLRDVEIASDSVNNLALPQTDRSRSASRDADARRQRRRERERLRDNGSSLTIPASTPGQSDQDEASSPPTTSPRHPDAVEARQREHRMSHQASLRSIVSASDTGTGTGDSLDEARIMQEIIEEGLLGDIDIDSLTEAEQDALAERIANLYRQRHPRPSFAASPPRSSRHADSSARGHDRTQNGHNSRSRSTQRSQTLTVYDTGERSQPSRSQPMPPNTLARSNSHGSSVTIQHTRRTSDQGRNQRTGGSRASSVEPQPASSDPRLTDGRAANTVSLVRRSSNNGRRQDRDAGNPQASTQMVGIDQRTTTASSAVATVSPHPARALPTPHTSQTQIPELHGDMALMSIDHDSIHYTEPIVTCFRCNSPNIQYDIFKHCASCNIDLCTSCYRLGKGCKHWYGFGHAAEINFENAKTRDDSLGPPHALIGRRYLKPVISTIVTKRPNPHGGDPLPQASTSNPLDRLEEGHFCDRCHSFSNTQFWLCDVCNDGEWGFCKTCVDTHHCCPHPLLPVAYYPPTHSQSGPVPAFQSSQTNSLQPTTANTPRGGLGLTGLSANTSRPQTPNSAFSTRSQREAGYDYLSINVNCDTCHQIILPSDHRYHCPSHETDFDICTPCYEAFIFHARSRRDGNATADTISGWRRCPSGHRMIVLTFEADISDEGDGGMRRVIKHDLVGGWKMNDTDIRAWNAQHNLYTSPPTSPPLSSNRAGTWSWKEDSSGTRRGTRSRAPTLTAAGSAGPSMRFPPDGGFGKRGQAYYAYWPEDGDAGAGELRLPRGAEVTEIEDVNGDWWSGVYAGDVGVFPFGYVREYR